MVNTLIKIRFEIEKYIHVQGKTDPLAKVMGGHYYLGNMSNRSLSTSTKISKSGNTDLPVFELTFKILLLILIV